jgi:hypothetical protein
LASVSLGKSFMALRKTRLPSRGFAIALVIAAAAAAMVVPAGAQWFGDRFPGYGEPQSRPQPQQRNFFSFPSFGNPGGGPFIRPPQPVESTKAPPPRKYDTQPPGTVVVIGDSLADWLAYGLEERFADTPEIGVVRRIRPTSGLVHYDPRNDTLEWSQAVKDILTADKPSAIVVMLGLNDRLPLRDQAPARPGTPHTGDEPSPAAGQAAQPSQQKPGAVTPAAPPAEAAQQDAGQPAAASDTQRQPSGGTYDFQTDKWAELYAKRIDDMIAALKVRGVPVLWVGLPALRGARATSDMSYLDELYRERAEKAGIAYVDIWDGFVDDQGRFAIQGPDFEGQSRRLRTFDGVHFTKAGAVKLASYVEQQLRRVMSNHLAPVALPAPEAASPAKPGGARPAVGPVLPLTASSSSDGNDLAGAGTRPSAVASDPVVQQVLSRGDPLTAPSGRADDFSWPRRNAGADADSAPDPVPQPVALTPSAALPAKGGAAVVKKPDDAKAKTKPAPTPAAVMPQRGPSASLGGRPAAPGGGF